MQIECNRALLTHAQCQLSSSYLRFCKKVYKTIKSTSELIIRNQIKKRIGCVKNNVYLEREVIQLIPMPQATILELLTKVIEGRDFPLQLKWVNRN